MARRWLMVPGLLVAGLVAAVGILATVTRQPKLATAYLGGQEFSLEVADTPSRISRGLAGRSSVPERGGMLFVFPQPDRYTVWMKGMLIPIDIIWLRGERVVGMVYHAPPPLPGTPDETLMRHVAPEPVDRVIELAAGRAEAAGLGIGQRIHIPLP